MIRRWTALGVITAEEKFRRIKGLCLLFIHPRLLASFTVALCSAINRSGVDCTF